MRSSPRNGTPYHAGERSLQTRLGVSERSEVMGRKMVHDYMSDQHRELFSRLPLVFVGSLAADGRPWASALYGAPGFMSSPDPRTLLIRALPAAPDPLAENLAVGRAVGLLGIKLETRRRNRMNGRVTRMDATSFAVQVDQSFGNCPQYIQAREPELLAWPEPPPPEVRFARLLPPLAERLIAESDTCFIASASGPRAAADPREGVDISHRGGRPGFVRVRERGGSHVLTMPDFAGNNAFNTLGNLILHPLAGLLFIDFGRGDLLSLTGDASLVLEGPEVARFEGAERLLELRLAHGCYRPRALPLRWSPAEPSPQVARTGRWRE